MMKKTKIGDNNMKITYKQYEEKTRIKYDCACGHKMYRINSDYFTVSPFNNKTLAQCRAQVKLNTHSKNRVCPKCGNKVSPTLSDKEKILVEQWKLEMN